MKHKAIIPSVILICSIFLNCGSNNNNSSQIEEQNVAIVQHMHEEISKGNIGVLKEVLSENYIRHCQAMAPDFQELHGTKQYIAFMSDFLNAVPNARDSIEVMLAKGDKVAYVVKTSGKQTGQMGNLPPSNNEFELINIIIHRFENGKIVESWVSWDNIAMLTQLGFFPPGGKANP